MFHTNISSPSVFAYIWISITCNIFQWESHMSSTHNPQKNEDLEPAFSIMHDVNEVLKMLQSKPKIQWKSQNWPQWSPPFWISQCGTLQWPDVLAKYQCIGSYYWGDNERLWYHWSYEESRKMKTRHAGICQRALFLVQWWPKVKESLKCSTFGTFTWFHSQCRNPQLIKEEGRYTWWKLAFSPDTVK